MSKLLYCIENRSERVWHHHTMLFIHIPCQSVLPLCIFSLLQTISQKAQAYYCAQRPSSNFGLLLLKKELAISKEGSLPINIASSALDQCH